MRRRAATLVALTAVVMGLMGAPSATAAAAPKVSPGTPLSGESFTVSTTLATKVARPVRLQRVLGGKWKTLRTKRSSSKGVVSFPMSSTASSVKVRLQAPRTKVGSRTYSTITTSARTARIAKTSASLRLTAASGNRVTAVVSAGPARRGRMITLQERTTGSWQTVTRKKATANATTFSSVMTRDRVRGRQLRAYVSTWKGSPGVATPTIAHPTVKMQAPVLVAGEPVALAATTGGTVRSVEFLVDGVSVGRATKAPWTVPWTATSGRHTFTARATGALDTVTSASVSATAEEPRSTVAMQAPDLSSDEVTLQATTTGRVDRVRFYVDGLSVGDDDSAPWSTDWRPTSRSHDVMVRAFGPDGSVLSDAVRVTRPATTVAADSGLPDGYSLEEVQSGFDLPTSFAVATSGAVFVTEKRGVVKVLEPQQEGYGLPREVLDVRSLVLQEGDRGLLGIVLDPDFADNGHVYVSSVLDDGTPGASDDQVQQVTRYTWDEDAFDPTTRHVVLGRVTGPACHAEQNLTTPDCVPIKGRSHSIGDLAFDDAGNLLVGIGDGALLTGSFSIRDRSQAIRAQDPEILAGKILRIDPVTGRGVPGNPMYEDSGESNASRAVATGLRNPFRFTVRGGGDGDPFNDELVLGDVGEGRFEEINVIDLQPSQGSLPNYGWPCFEGGEQTTLPAVEDPQSPWHPCQGVRESGEVTSPIYAYPHSGGGSITGGVFVDSEAYPADLRGRYVFGDYAQNFIRTADIDHHGDTSDVRTLADGTAAAGPVKFAQGPDGLLWYLSIYTGSLRRLVHEPGANADRCGVGQFRRTFHDLDGEDSVFDREYPDGEFRWLFPWAAASLPAKPMADATCTDGVTLASTPGSPWLPRGVADERDHPGDRFGVAWRGRVQLEAGTHRFKVAGNDWVRLWVNDEKLHDFYASPWWQGAAPEAMVHEVTLPAGQHTIRAELVHGTGPAAANVSWEKVGSPPKVSIKAPANGVVLTDGRLSWEAQVQDDDGDSRQALVDSLVVTADLMHFDGDDDYHAHPFAERASSAAGTFELKDDHAPGESVFRLRARATDASGATTTSAPVYVCLTGNLVGPCADER